MGNGFFQNSTNVILPLIVLVILQIPVTIRRLHYTGKPNSRIFLFLIPMFNFIYFIYLAFCPTKSIQKTIKIDSQIEKKSLICPKCDSNNCAYDKNNERIANILSRIFRTSNTVTKDCHCFECGNHWEV